MKVYLVWYITTGYENSLQYIFKDKEKAEQFIITSREPQNYFMTEADVNE